MPLLLGRVPTIMILVLVLLFSIKTTMVKVNPFFPSFLQNQVLSYVHLYISLFVMMVGSKFQSTSCKSTSDVTNAQVFGSFGEGKLTLVVTNEANTTATIPVTVFNFKQTSTKGKFNRLLPIYWYVSC